MVGFHASWNGATLGSYSREEKTTLSQKFEITLSTTTKKIWCKFEFSNACNCDAKFFKSHSIYHYANECYHQITMVLRENGEIETGKS